MRIARGELGETSDHLEAGAQKKYIDPEEYEDLVSLCARALAANGGLLNFLEGNSKKPR